MDCFCVIVRLHLAHRTPMRATRGKVRAHLICQKMQASTFTPELAFGGSADGEGSGMVGILARYLSVKICHRQRPC